jgi:pilus assembly protein CpaC
VRPAAAAEAAKEGISPVVTLEALAAAIQSLKPAPAKPTASPVLSAEPARMGPDMTLTLGKSTLLRLPEPVERFSIGNPAVADATVISERELYLLGKDLGTTNLIIWSRGGQATVIDLNVTADPSLLEAELLRLLPGEREISVRSSADSIVLTGTVADAVKAAQAVEIAEAWVRRLTRALVQPTAQAGTGATGSAGAAATGAGRQAAARLAGPRVINMLSVRAPMQVMLEVKVAEVSKNLLDRLGVSTRLTRRAGNVTFDTLSRSNFLNELLGAAAIVRSPLTALQIDGQRDDGLVKLLAEPNIMAISGQEASFRAGGKIFIPVARRSEGFGTTITLEEREFGVGLRFKPTVLADNRINLHVAPEVSELQQTGTPFTTVQGATSVLPSFTVRRAETTVQLNDGQSFMIAGLIQNNVSQSMNRFPGLGDVPILGALFRSTEFQADRSELMFVITPRLVKPLPPDYALPTDAFAPPNVKELYLEGRQEGDPARAEGSAIPAGFEMK